MVGKRYSKILIDAELNSVQKTIQVQTLKKNLFVLFVSFIRIFFEISTARCGVDLDCLLGNVRLFLR